MTAPGSSTDHIPIQTPARVPSPTSNPAPIAAPPTSFRQPPTSTNTNVPMDPLKSFLRWSTSTSTTDQPSVPDSGRSTWSFHPEEYDPDPAAVRLSTISNDNDFGTGGEAGGATSRTSFDTFGHAGRGPEVSPTRAGVGRTSSRVAGKDGRDDRQDALQQEMGNVELPGTVLKFNRNMRRSAQSPTKHAISNSTSSTVSSSSNDDTPRVHFGNGNRPLAPIEGSPSILRSPTRHRPAASTSNLEMIHARPPTAYIPRMRTRSKSIDSISLNPSISDSVTGLLMPIKMTPKIPLVHPSTLPEELMAKNDLDPEQRAILLRRAKKLEQLLGQSLDERSIERLLIDPIHASRTVTTDISDQAWPESPTHSARRGSKAEWQKDDCVPRKTKLVDQSSTPTPSHGGLARSGSFIARTARAALGLGNGGKEKEKDLAVYVSREVRLSETGVRGAKPRPRHSISISTPPGSVNTRLNQSSLPRGDMTGSPGMDELEEGEGDEDEAARRTRRLQLAKLHRLLGVPIPPDLVSRQSSSSIERDRDSTTTPRANSPDPERSYIVMDDTLITPSPSWSAMLKNTLSLGLTRARRSSTPGRVTPVPTPPPMVRGESFVDMSTMNEKEKSVARRKAQKLEYMFGDTPPQAMFLPPRPATPSGQRTSTEEFAGTEGRDRQTSHGSFKAYQQSLTNLLYLADNDSATLDILMDRLDIDTDSDQGHGFGHGYEYDQQREERESGRQSSMDSHEIRRKRTGKLTHFFGETGIDFNDPPNVATTMERVRSRTGTPSGSGSGSGHGGKGKDKDTLDEMMREMWRVVQIEVRRGGMAVKDGERLGELIDRLRFRRGERVKLD